MHIPSPTSPSATMQASERAIADVEGRPEAGFAEVSAGVLCVPEFGPFHVGLPRFWYVVIGMAPRRKLLEPR